MPRSAGAHLFFRPLLPYLLALAGSGAVRGQCYQFSSGNAATLTVEIKSVPAPTILPNGAGGNIYQYHFPSASTANISMTVGQTTYSLPISLTITIGTTVNFSSFQVGTEFADPNLPPVLAGVRLGWFGPFLF